MVRGVWCLYGKLDLAHAHARFSSMRPEVNARCLPDPPDADLTCACKRLAGSMSTANFNFIMLNTDAIVVISRCSLFARYALSSCKR